MMWDLLARGALLAGGDLLAAEITQAGPAKTMYLPAGTDFNGAKVGKENARRVQNPKCSDKFKPTCTVTSFKLVIILFYH